MESLRGRRLTILSLGLIVLAGVAAMAIVVSGGLRPRVAAGSPSGGAPSGGTGDPAQGGTPRERVEMALAAEQRGEVATAIHYYREAVAMDPRCVDRKSPEFLGLAFEEKLKGWVLAFRRGEFREGPEAARDVAFLFRRMYGGCG